MNDISPNLLDVLADCATDGGGKNFTHMTMFDQRRWLVDNSQLSNFWYRYCGLVSQEQEYADDLAEEDEDEVVTTQLCMGEKPETVMPVIAKVLLKFEKTVDMEDWDIYDDSFLCSLVLAYQMAIYENFLLTSGNNSELMALVLESESHWFEPDGTRFMEIRIQFPYARINTSDQRKILRPQVISKLRMMNPMKELERQPIGDWEQILVPDVLDRPLPMYGSVEVYKRPRMLLNRIYPLLSESMFSMGQFPNYVGNLDECFKPANHNHVQQGLIPLEILRSQPTTYWLPMFLSTNYLNIILVPKPELQHQQVTPIHTNIQNINSPARYDRDLGEEKDSQIAERLIPMLDPNRYFNQSNWMDVGKALYAAHQGAETGLQAWIRHTKRAISNQMNLPYFMIEQGSLEETIRSNYSMFTDDGAIDIKTMGWYASIDNPQAYGTWHRDWCMVAMDKALSITHSDVAYAFFRTYWLEFNYCGTRGAGHSRGIWSVFKSHRWVESHGGSDIRMKITMDFARKFEVLRNVIGQQKLSSRDEEFNRRAEDAIQKIGELIKKLKNNGFKNALMSELSDLYSDDMFNSRLDNKPELLGLTNGVLECNETIIFRPTKPQDYVSMSTKVSYRSDFTWESPQVKKCMKYLNEVYTDPEMRNHFLKFGASCLRGLNSDKIFPFFVGDGNNSKSMIVKLFENTFGQYCIKFDIANLSNNSKNASGASPQLARAKGVHIAFIDEPDDDAEIKKGTMKRWVGGDSFFTRMLYEAGGDLRVFFKLVLSCNKPPVIENPDGASKNRVRLYPHTSEWVKEGCPENYEEQLRNKKFKMNPNFEDQIPGMASAFLWILVQYYPVYKSEGLNDPAAVEEYTNSYWRENDIYAQFASESVEAAPMDALGQYDTNAQVTLTDIYEEFKVWFRTTFPGKPKVPDRTVVKSELVSRWGRMHGNHWLGLRLIPKNNPGGAPMAMGNKNYKPAQAQAQPVVGGNGNLRFNNQHSEPVQLNIANPMISMTTAAPPPNFSIPVPTFITVPPPEPIKPPMSPHMVKPLVGPLSPYKGPISPVHNTVNTLSYSSMLNPSAMMAELNQAINQAVPLSQ